MANVGCESISKNCFYYEIVTSISKEFLLCDKNLERGFSKSACPSLERKLVSSFNFLRPLKLVTPKNCIQKFFYKERTFL